MSGIRSTETNTRRTQRLYSSIPSTTATFVVGGQRENCCYCRESHFPSACKSVIEERREMLHLPQEKPLKS